MGTLTLQTKEEIWGLQDRLPDSAVSSVEFDMDTLTVSWSDPDFDVLILGAADSLAAGEPVPSIDPVVLASKLEDAKAAIGRVGTSIVTLSGDVSRLTASGGELFAQVAGLDERVAGLQSAMSVEGETLRGTLSDLAERVSGATTSIARILSDQQSYSRAFSDVSVGRRAWVEIPSVGGLVVSPQMAGQWVFSVFAGDQEDGKGIATRVLLNGEIVAGNSVDGTNKIDGSYSSVGAVMSLAAGDVVSFEISHDIAGAEIAGRIAGAKLF